MLLSTSGPIDGTQLWAHNFIFNLSSPILTGLVFLSPARVHPTRIYIKIIAHPQILPSI